LQRPQDLQDARDARRRSSDVRSRG
jgi:hypothetical protein